MDRQAIISDCGTFRYRLSRMWSPTPPLAFVMLNPSTADANLDDPTIRKCIGFAERLGFGGIDVVNLFAFRATDPKDLRNNGSQVGPENDYAIQRCARLARAYGSPVICAWGANARSPLGQARATTVRKMLGDMNVELRALRLLRDGVPEHPLMLPYSCKPVNLPGAA